MVMSPGLPEVSSNYTPPAGLQFVQSRYSQGGDLAPTPANNYGSSSGSIDYMKLAQAQQSVQQNHQASGESPIGISPSDAGSIASKFVNGNFSDKISSATGALNNFGSSYLGFGSGNVSYASAFGPEVSGAASAFGPGMEGASAVADGILGTSQTFSGFLGGAGIGAVTGGLMESLNIIGGNSTGATVGGAIGGALGSLIPIPIVGSVVGGAVGSWIGSQFGNKTPATAADSYTSTLNADGSFKNLGGGSKNPGSYAGYAKDVDTTLGKVFSGASKQLGITFSDKIDINSGYNSLYSGDRSKPAYIDVAGPDGRQRFNYVPDDTAGKNEAYQQALTFAAKQSGYTDTAKLQEYFKVITGSNNSTMANRPGTPNIGMSSGTFADYMAKNKGSSNGNGTPNV